jgi:hypothetical protein
MVRKRPEFARGKYAIFLDLFFGLSRFGNLDQGWVIGLLGLVDFFWARIPYCEPVGVMLLR